MGSEAKLKSWVSHKLMSLLGYSQPTVVQYIIGFSNQASSSGDVVGKLVEFGLSSSTETRAFAEEIYARLPRKNAGVNSLCDSATAPSPFSFLFFAATSSQCDCAPSPSSSLRHQAFIK
ncbi:pre-mRNA-splicing factor ATP-dependent RNA helicase DEAH1-like isoform X3 [Amaranthus tricolor]|uniref:pre-mRNA-splicing factor ATP-dependent RNA helicase DEAH1-like isoform X3 n=1 Tax=Amaranthus tricolor TaxID=29722 RepID=UPI002588EA74|nr:pre-mRNA-splicing factor ATP-dependent RNA helicase DEAH1-like isoform X3 [Amaranthus tricolor]